MFFNRFPVRQPGEHRRTARLQEPRPHRLLAFAFLVVGIGFSQSPPVGIPGSGDIIQFLTQTTIWYHQLAGEQQIATQPSDLMVVNNNQQIANQIVRLAFDFARAQTDLLTKHATSNQAQIQNGDAARDQSLLQLSGQLDKQVRDIQEELESVRRKLETATGRKRETLESTIPELRSELDLANARREAVHSMAEFASGATANGVGASGLRAQVEALARSIPAASTKPSNNEDNGPTLTDQFSAASASVINKEPSGIWALAADVFALSPRIHALDETIRLTDDLAKTARDLRTPLVTSVQQLTRQGDTLANQADTASPSALVQEKKDLDALTAQFRQISAAVLPLGKQGILLGLYKTNVTNWQSTIKSRYHAELRSLLLRLAILGAVLALVFGIGELWRRTIFRYVHDPRRRYAFLLLRKIVLWFLIIIIIAFAFATELGSVATFAGLLTAGVAVALQNVILSIAGYFFLIGRFGIRVGDRVQIADVTGEVVDIGLVRLHLMEFGIGGPSGRVVAFSNSIVFQPTAGLFKQIPGTNFVWHEISLMLAPDSDYGSVEERLLGAVKAVFADYREEMDRQRQEMERTFSSVPMNGLQPKSWLRLTQAGLEAVIRFPVDLKHATEIDDRVTRELLKAIDREPKLKLVGSGTPGIRLRTDLSASKAATA
jgi:small-conductance mechanosensitive channel